MDIDKTLEEREKTYGNFYEYSLIARRLKYVVEDLFLKNEGMSAMHKEALDMIMSKIARILNGEPNYIDNWHDIAGYATLIVNNLEDEEGIE